jgi:hypothetical protein
VWAYLVLLAALAFVLRRRDDAEAEGLRLPVERRWARAG